MDNWWRRNIIYLKGPDIVLSRVLAVSDAHSIHVPCIDVGSSVMIGWSKSTRLTKLYSNCFTTHLAETNTISGICMRRASCVYIFATEDLWRGDLKSAGQLEPVCVMSKLAIRIHTSFPHGPSPNAQ